MNLDKQSEQIKLINMIAVILLKKELLFEVSRMVKIQDDEDGGVLYEFEFLYNFQNLVEIYKDPKIKSWFLNDNFRDDLKNLLQSQYLINVRETRFSMYLIDFKVGNTVSTIYIRVSSYFEESFRRTNKLVA